MKKFVPLLLLMFIFQGCMNAELIQQIQADREAAVNAYGYLPDKFREDMLSGKMSVDLFDYGYHNREYVPEIRKYWVDLFPDMPEKIKNNILEGTVSLGMTKEQLLMARGHPRDTGKHVSSYSVSEWMSYGYRTFYLEDNIVTSWSE